MLSTQVAIVRELYAKRVHLSVDDENNKDSGERCLSTYATSHTNMMSAISGTIVCADLQSPRREWNEAFEASSLLRSRFTTAKQPANRAR